jgi:hypothetical protein
MATTNGAFARVKIDVLLLAQGRFAALAESSRSIDYQQKGALAKSDAAVQALLARAFPVVGLLNSDEAMPT